MLFSMPKLSREPATFISVASTEVRVEYAGWTVCIDAPLGRSRVPELERDARHLITLLKAGDTPKLERSVFESLFGGHFVAIAYDEARGQVFVLRDVAGAKTIYYADDGEKLFVGNVQSEVARALPAPHISVQSARMMMVLDHYLDGDTQYSEVSEVEMGTILTTDRTGDLGPYLQFDLALFERENGKIQPDNARLLHESIIIAHERRISADNVVMLSGGIDSSVMLAALRAIVDGSRLRAVSFKVKGTSQDETVYATQLANALDVPIEVIEVDPTDEEHFASFEEDLLAMNSPYPGRFIYGNLAGGPDTVFFAGQDTRLHTPDLNRLDQVAFSLLPLQRNRLGRSLARGLVDHVLEPITSLRANYAAAPRWRRGLYRAALAPDLDRYVQRFLFQIDETRWQALGIDDESARHYAESVAINCESVRNTRHLYNRVVARRWPTQYTDDMRYLQDLARLNGTHVALPFYDIALARLSSGLPMDQTTRFVPGRGKFDARRTRVNKALLREAFRAELPADLLMRAKAVSNTQHLLYSGVMGRKIRAILAADMARGAEAIVRRLEVTDYVNKFMTMTEYRSEDEAFLNRVFRIAAMAHISRRFDT
ncbi:hypothetical protein HGG71_03780 [Rhodobacteraceae bacterium R_SAG2]|nr:hypothetical protein [Rhodobacteraceae bacterium R_SAG2]